MANEWIETPYGQFSADYCVARLSNLCDPNAGIQTGPFGSQLHQEDYVQIGTPIITVEHLGENRILHANTPKVSGTDRDRLSRYQLNQGDIVFSRVGSVDRRALVREKEEGWLFSGRCLRVRPDPSKIDSQYLSYFFGLSAFKEHIRSIAVGATMPSLNTSLLSEIVVPYPPSIEEQRAIAHILGTLDDKIELNRRANETLEAMARALFKAWFVDFEPVRAKLEGRWQRGQSRPGLPAHLYNLFPDRLVESELGELPEGWRHSTIGAEVSVCGGSTPSTKEANFWEGGHHCWATPKDLSALKFPVLLNTDRKITDAGLAKISSGLLPVGTVLLSSRAPIGYLAIAEVPTAINQGFIAMKCDGVLPNVFVLLWCRESMDAIVGNANGSTFQEISKTNFRPIPVVVPSEPVLTRFRKSADSLYRQMVENERESRSLAQLRDTLLPKLISGELRVGDVDKFLGGVI
ncbi:type I restriction endonuclease subunit S [Cupriavidus sp. HPC(L)]|uniref:restriction endonuclease subunit S n=1 Tax=Cupriavidus sp. HPC(L) TaxID=1217418 RepID=UPI0003BF02FB|nr:restriction endonuclease subunit S [Cupriavidus sp. HPC(L)]ESJ26647.1 type I restriction endonuclease subunit S [Cupriavidus sp. HPC(L)]